jgi:hypothetical protein
VYLVETIPFLMDNCVFFVLIHGFMIMEIVKNVRIIHNGMYFQKNVIVFKDFSFTNKNVNRVSMEKLCFLNVFVMKDL